MIPQLSPMTRRAIVFGAAATTVYMAMTLGTLARLEAISGLTPFDMRPLGYDPEAARHLLTSLGEAGRQFYLGRQIVLDTIYPLLLALTLSCLFRLFGGGAAVRAGVVLSWLTAALDYAENAGIAAMLVLWPDLPDAVIRMASAATVAKSFGHHPCDCGPSGPRSLPVVAGAGRPA